MLLGKVHAPSEARLQEPSERHFKLGEHMLYITNKDKPGVIGAIGGSTAERGINIANLHLGRDARNGNAMVLLEVDERLDNDDLEHLRSLPNITNVQYLHFPAMQ